MIQLRRAAAPLVALAATGLLGGCSHETAAAPAGSSTTAGATPPPPVAPAPAPAVAGAPTPTSVATRVLPVPEQSELSRTFTVDGASAYAAYYLEVLNHSRDTGDPSLLQKISDPGCSGCQFDVSEIEGYREHGYTDVGLKIQFLGTHVTYQDMGVGEVQLEVSTRRPQHRVVDQAGRVLSDVPEMPEGTFVLDLKWQDGRWVIWEVS